MTSNERGEPCNFCEFSSSRYGYGSEQDDEAEVLREQVQQLRSQLLKMTGRADDVSFTELEEIRRSLGRARLIVEKKKKEKEKQQKEREEQEREEQERGEQEKQDKGVVPSSPPPIDDYRARLLEWQRVLESRKSESLQRKRDRLLVCIERMNGRRLEGMTSDELDVLYCDIGDASLEVFAQMNTPLVEQLAREGVYGYGGFR